MYVCTFSILFLLSAKTSAQYSSVGTYEQSYQQDFDFIEDINGDGILDVVLNESSVCEDEYLIIYHGRLDATSGKYFYDLVYKNYYDYGFFKYLMDVDGDGRKEFLSEAIGDDRITITRFENGQYVDHIIENEDIDLTFIADVNNDGKDENLRRVSDTFYRGNFDEDLTYTETVFFEMETESLSVYDYNHDGILDFLFFDDNELHVLIIDDGISEEIVIPDANLDFAFYKERLFYDVDQNGDVEYLYRPIGGYDLYVAWNIESNGFSQVELLGRSSELEDNETFQYIDVDLDGVEDLVVRLIEDGEEKFVDVKTGATYDFIGGDVLEAFNHFETEGQHQIVVGSNYRDEVEEPLAILELDVNPVENTISYQEIPIYLPEYKSLDYAVKTDVNQNGTIDLLFQVDSRSDFGNGVSIRWIEDVEGSAPELSQLILGHNSNLGMTIFSDVDNDGDVDIISARDFTIYYNDGFGDFLARESILTGVDELSKIIEDDFDSDGLPDFVLHRRNGELMVISNIDGQNFEVENIYSTSGGSSWIQLAKVNDDPNLDIVMTAGSTVYTFIGEGNGNFSDAAITQLQNTFYSELKDIDLDGRVEFVGELFGDVYSVDFGDDHKLDAASYRVLFEGDSFDTYMFFDVDKDGDDDLLTVENSNSRIKWWEFESPEVFTARGLLEDEILLPSEYLFSGVYLSEEDQFVQVSCGRLLFTQPDAKSLNICFNADINSNGVTDAEDYRLPFYEFAIRGGSSEINQISDPSGCVQLRLQPGDYEITSTNGGCLTLDEEINVGGGISDIMELHASPSEGDFSVIVDLVSAPTRCGFTVDHWLTVKNDLCEGALGSIEIELSEISLWSTFDADFEYFQFEGFITIDVSDLRPGETKKLNFSMEIPDFNSSGEDLEHTVRVLSMEASEVGRYEYESEIRCAYDPNDKNIIPNRTEEFGAAYITDETLQYLIRFQNVGNDTAINIRVEDVISNNLDLASLTNVQSSHNYRYKVDSESRLMEFFFEDIYLVDSLTDEINSHGFIKFDINPVEGLSDFDEVDNSASIFFDFNPAVVTNTVESQFVYDLSILTSAEEEATIDDWLIAPNPVSSQLNISNLQMTNCSIELYNLAGQKVYSSSVSNGDVQNIDVRSIASGVYFLRISNDDGARTKKVVIE